MSKAAVSGEWLWYNALMDKLPITIIIIARNEESNLRQLLPSLVWAEKVLVIGNQCTDQTAQVCQELGAEFVASELTDFAQLRDLGRQKVTTPWIFYLDADERVTTALLQELTESLKDEKTAVFSMRRQNYHYGFLMAHGGWDNDWVTRVFRRESLQGWQGEIHESPLFEGEVKKLEQPLWHLTHRCTAENLAKSSRWTIKEARLLARAGVKPVTGLTLGRKVIMEFWRRFIRQRGYKVGMAGLVESLTQAFNRGFVYMQVWELQQQPSLSERYQQLEEEAKSQS